MENQFSITVDLDQMKSFKKPNENAPLLIDFDKRGYRNALDSIEEAKIFFEECIRDFASLGIGTFEASDSDMLFLATEGFLFAKIMNGKSTHIGELELDKDKVFAMIKKPQGYFGLINKITKFTNQLEKHPPFPLAHNFEGLLNCFTFYQAGNVEINAGEMQRIKTHFEIYITSDMAKKYYQFAVQLKDI